MRYERRGTPAVFVASAVGATALLAGGPAAAAAAPAPKVRNAGLEQVSGGLPQCWAKYTTGDNAGSVASVAGGQKSGRAATVTVTRHRSGARALLQSPGCAIKVNPGKKYDLQLAYKTTSDKSALTVLRQKKNGSWVKWYTFPYLPSSTGFRASVGRTPAVPAGTKAIRFGQGLFGTGTLTTDNYKISLAKGTAKCAGSECTKGHWIVNDFGDGGVRAMHSVVLNNGKVLLIAGSGNGGARFKRGEFVTKVYDPKTNTFTNVPTPYDMFCAGHVQLPDGRVLVLGGTEDFAEFSGGVSDEGIGYVYESKGWSGAKKSYIFDPATNRYSRVNDMVDGHWYPSATLLGNGDVYSVGGYDYERGPNEESVISPYSERFSWATRKWLGDAKVPETDINWATYPSLVLAANGKLFYNGSSVFGHPSYYGNGKIVGPGYLDPATGAYREIGGTRDDAGDNAGLRYAAARDQSASLLLPPAQDQRVMVIGGKDFTDAAGFGLRATDVIDLRKGNSANYADGPNLPYGKVEIGGQIVQQGGGKGKVYVSAVILADGKVMETGGSQYNRAEHVHEASILDPAKSTGSMRWKSVAADPVARTYHSSAVLLPDGRVMAIGSNPDISVAADGGDSYFDTRISIYYPPYLYTKGEAPKVTKASKRWSYGSAPTITTSTPVTSAYLVRPIAVTHSSDPNQRAVKLPLKSLGGNRYRLDVTGSRNIAPPGWYMLFVKNKSGKPSAASWVRIG
ncbi:N-acetylneuraminic acid mutarotase [Actinocorallia herbida]|uniref:N-acetylneuraminic acid mutarotase n=1 Tax=Actinocorallia herbida TaxID=58109 RepID=A0A3N1CR97_9ACTN|nr:galactose oxidase-like domain-containing protein [Actinocorallia herbida]ROO83674.1 N-acetylneuraminic acid mutarotase [Actinocorallia herbida]